MNELHYAAYCGDLAAVHHWIEHLGNLDAIDEVGNTALHWNSKMACARGERLEVLDALVIGGASMNLQNHDGQTPLASAIESTASNDFIQRLKHHGAI